LDLLAGLLLLWELLALTVPHMHLVTSMARLQAAVGKASWPWSPPGPVLEAAGL